MGQLDREIGGSTLHRRIVIFSTERAPSCCEGGRGGPAWAHRSHPPQTRSVGVPANARLLVCPGPGADEKKNGPWVFVSASLHTTNKAIARLPLCNPTHRRGAAAVCTHNSSSSSSRGTRSSWVQSYSAPLVGTARPVNSRDGAARAVGARISQPLVCCPGHFLQWRYRGQGGRAGEQAFFSGVASTVPSLLDIVY